MTDLRKAVPPLFPFINPPEPNSFVKCTALTTTHEKPRIPERGNQTLTFRHGFGT
jgi:hypothetical protein